MKEVAKTGVMKVLSTKTLDEEILDYARSLTLDVQCVDFIETKKIAFDIASVEPGFDSVAFTSASAVRYFFENANAMELLVNKNVFSLSGKTQEELLKHLTDISLVKENAEDLANAIIQARLSRSVLHVAGNLTLDVLEKKLKNAGISYSSLVVYETILISRRVLNKDFGVIMFFSPSGVESFCMTNKFSNEINYCCIGTTTANALKEKHPRAKIILPEHPTPESMINAIHQFANVAR